MEFQAIILAGGSGSRMYELTSQIPKCLLPIGNKPMIWYPVRMLEKAGFSEINILTLNSIKSKLETELKSNCGIRANLNIVGIDDSKEDYDGDDLGTANSLALLKDKITKDCILVSCDLISNLNIQLMASYYRVTNAAFVMLLSDNTGQVSDQLPLPGSKEKYSPESDLIGLDMDTNRLLYFNESEVEEIKIKSSITERYPKITWTTKLQDGHFYIMKKWMFDFIVDSGKKFCSIKEDFLPYLIKKQFSTHKKRFNELNVSSNHSSSKKPIATSTSKPKIFDYIKVDELTHIINKASSNKDNHDVFACHAFIQADGFCLRANNLAIYAEANRQIVGKILPFFQRERTESFSKNEKSQFGSDTVIGEGTTIGTEQSFVKRSVIGKNCRIGNKVKITNSVLLDNVEIVGENVTITGSIIASNCKINQKSELKDCLIGFNQDIQSGKYASESLVEQDSFMDE